MLRSTLGQSRKRAQKTKIYSMEVCYDGDLVVICKNCGFFIAPLAAAEHYMNVDIEEYRFGNHFLVLGQYKVESLSVQHENAIFNTEEPFLYMYLKPVHCSFCFQTLGLNFMTANLMGTEWLLNRFALNMEQVELDYKRSMLMESTINQLHGALVMMEVKKKKDRLISLEIEKEKEFEEKFKSIQNERLLEKTILKHTQTSFPQNKEKGRLADLIIQRLSFFDRRTEKLEKIGKKMLAECETLKTKIVDGYGAFQKNKIEMIKMKKATEREESSRIRENCTQN